MSNYFTKLSITVVIGVLLLAIVTTASALTLVNAHGGTVIADDGYSETESAATYWTT